MSLTMLQVVQQFCLRTGISSPDAVAASTDDQTLQILGLLNEILDNLTSRKTLSLMKVEATFNTLAQESQGAITTHADQGYKQIIDGVMFNRTTGQWICGPVPATNWQAAKAELHSISHISYRLRGGTLYLTPAPAVDEVIAFEYKSDHVVIAADTSLKQYFTVDTDTCLFPHNILIAGLRWIWKKEKGLRYAEDFRSFENLVGELEGGDEVPYEVDVTDTAETGPSINAPDMNWDL